jgi:S1-C subfamily serine protease
MGLKVRFATGPRTGAVQAFPDDAERIVLGRDPTRCQVVFPAEERVVGREHCALERVLGRYRLVLNGADLVLVDSQPAVEGQELGDQASLQLGVGGPVVDVRTFRNPRLAATQIQTLPTQQTLGSRMASATSSARRNRHLGLVTLLVLVAAAAVGWRVLCGTRSEVEEAQTRQVQAEGRLEKALLAQQERSEREKRELEARFLKEKEALLGQMAGFSEQLEQLKPHLRKAVTAAAPSVYLMIVRSPEGREVGVATAWVIKPGVLATNAHVAQILKDLPKGARFAARSSDPKTPDIPIREVRIHPARDLFKEVWQDYEPAYGLSSKSMERVEAAGDAFDVGLLTVEEGFALAPPLPLASQADLEALGVGEPVGYVGYPSENVALAGGRHPSATTHLGYVTAATDYFGATAATPPSSRHLILHSLPAAGGASGSPILNERGQVVAVLSGGNLVGAGGKRISTGVGVNFAQRADLLAELLEDRGPALMQERRKDWERQLREQFESGFVVRRDDLAVDLQTRLARSLNDPAPGAPEDPWTKVLDRTVPLVALKDVMTVVEVTQAVVDTAIEVLPGTTWLVLVGAGQQKPIRLDVSVDSGDPPSPPVPSLDPQPWLRYALFEPAKAGKLVVRVSSPLGARECRLLVLRADRTLKHEISPLEKIRVEWLEVLEREQGKSFTAVDVHASSERLARTEGGPGGEKVLAFSFDAPGAYLVAAFAPGLADIDMIVRAAGSGAPLWIDNQTDPMPIGRLTVDAKGLKVEVRVVGPAAGIDFDLRVWRGKP